MKWEYRVEYSTADDSHEVIVAMMNVAGASGWELITSVQEFRQTDYDSNYDPPTQTFAGAIAHYFKRPVNP